MMSDPGLPLLPGHPGPTTGPAPASPPHVVAAEAPWPKVSSGDAIIAVASTGAVTAMNLTAVTLLGHPAPHQFGLGLCQFIPARYHRVVEAWDEREEGDARAAHPDRHTLSMSALRVDGSEVRVLVTRRVLGDGPSAPYVVTLRTMANAAGPIFPAPSRDVRYRPNHPSPIFG